MRADELHRTARALVEDERFASLEEAVRFLETFVLQVDVSGKLRRSEQAMLLTILNTASRAFLGGVRVRITEDAKIGVGWAGSMRLAEAATSFGGQVVEELDPRHPTLAFGDANTLGELVLWPTWNGWSGGVVLDRDQRLTGEVEFELAAAMAGAMAVSECFQYLAGDPRACHRSFGVSLWRPEADWRSTEAIGPACAYLPKSYWLPGVGHLGQAYAWMIGLLPYADPGDVALTIQDFDYLEKANESTCLLARPEDRGHRKTRVVAKQLELLGFVTTIVERPFDEHTVRSGDEPLLCLAGFDSPVPRRALGSAGFDRVVDAGLGTGRRHFLDMLVQSFRAGVDTSDKFPDQAPAPTPEELRATPAFNELVARLVAAGEDEGDAECGMVDVAGTTAAASFVGAVSAAIALSEPLRLLHGGNTYEAIALSLRDPERIEVARGERPDAPVFGTSACR